VTNVSLAFVEPGLAAFGSTELVRRAIDVKGGAVVESIAANEQMMNLMTTVDSGTVWAAGRLDALETGMTLPPPLSRFAQQLTTIDTFALSARIDSGVDAMLRADARDEPSAASLREAVQGLLALGKITGGSRPGLKSLVDSFQLTGGGTRLILSFRIPPELFDQLGTTIPSIPDFR
jgi:hypothetical protein